MYFLRINLFVHLLWPAGSFAQYQREVPFALQYTLDIDAPADAVSPMHGDGSESDPTRTFLAPGYAYEQLGVFCKLEVHLERYARFPILIRIGDVMQVDTWEGKGPWRSSPLVPVR